MRNVISKKTTVSCLFDCHNQFGVSSLTETSFPANNSKFSTDHIDATRLDTILHVQYMQAYL
jgi:hypothetical protein